MARREHPRYENTEWPDYEFREFPMMVYPGADDPMKPYKTKGKQAGKPLDGIIVQNEEERRIALGLEAEEVEETGATRKALPTRGGRTMPTTAKGVDRLRTDDDEKEDLLQQAENLGLKVDKSWSVGRIQDAIDTHNSAVV